MGVTGEGRLQTLRERTGWFDSHPATLDRISTMSRGNDTDIFTLNGPATALFADSPAVCKAATIGFDRALFDENYRKLQLRSVAQFVASVTGKQA